MKKPPSAAPKIVASRTNYHLTGLMTLVPVTLIALAVLIIGLCWLFVARNLTPSNAKGHKQRGFVDRQMPVRSPQPPDAPARTTDVQSGRQRQTPDTLDVRQDSSTRLVEAMSEVQEPDPETPTPFQQFCDEAQRQIGGTLTVTLGHNSLLYCYPNEQAACQKSRAASVIKLQIVACYLATITDTMLKANPPELALCRKAISVSDNDAANRLMDIVGIANVNRFAEIHDFTATELMHHFNEPLPLNEESSFNQTSAADQVQFLRDLWEERILTLEPRELMLDWMHRQERRTKIPRYLNGYDVYNKTGETWDPPVQNDVAIIKQGDNIWYLAIFTADSPKPYEEVNASIAKLAKTLVTSL